MLKNAKKSQPYLDPLPSWNNRNPKQKIIEFVNKVTKPHSLSFVHPNNRIATFDNDGTLWTEQPLYNDVQFDLEYIYQQIKKNPKLAHHTPYFEIKTMKNLLTNDSLESIPGILNILLTAFPNITQEKYLEKAYYFLSNTKNNRFKRALKDLTYMPMVELIHYLQNNNFKTFIVTGGSQGMTRAVSEEVYHVEPRNVIGTHPQFTYALTKHGPSIIRQPILSSNNDGVEKAINIQKIIGKKPIFACGNTGGDFEMLRLTTHSKNHFACMINHDDGKREYSYPNKTALDESQRSDWTVISMKKDFATIF